MVRSGTNNDGVAKAAAAFGPGKSQQGFLADLSQHDAGRQLVKDVLGRFGRIDILVNNAGVVSRIGEWELTPEEWDRVHDVNLRATFFVSRDAAVSMRENGGGAIINVSSIAGQHGSVAGSPAYASSKAAVIGLTCSLARRFAPADIETDMTANWPQPLRGKLNSLTPLGRFGAVDEVVGRPFFWHPMGRASSSARHSRLMVAPICNEKTVCW